MSWIVLLVVLAVAIVYRCHRYLTLSIVAALLLLFGFFHLASVVSLAIFWLLYLPTACLLLLDPLRRSVLSARVMAWFTAQQPAISKAERVVLDSGNVWWEAEFFQSTPNWDRLSALPSPTFTPAEQAFLDHQVPTLCALLDDWEITHKLNDLPKEAWDYIKKERFWGMVIPESYGGLGFSPYLHSQVIATLASCSTSAALTVMVPNSLGPAEFLQHYGTQAQKDTYLPQLASGEEIACFALTAPNAGSDATHITDRGVVCQGEYDGASVLGIRLNFDKRYITLAPIATLIGLAFQLVDPEHLLGETENLGITLALVPSHLPGVSRGTRHCPMGQAFLNGPVRGKDVFIPLDFVIGGPEYCGKGWQMLMECLSIGRSISLPALAAGSAQLAYRTSSAYAYLREQFHRPIGAFDGVKEALAKVGGLTYIIEATRWFTVDAVAKALHPAIASAIAKYHCTEMARAVLNAAMDIHGGRAVQIGPANYLANLYQSMPISITVEGANILTRCLIIFGQGALRCHPYLEKEITAAEQGDLQTFDRLCLQHLAAMARHALVAFGWGVLGRSGSYYRQLERFAAGFAFLADITMALLGKDLKSCESISGKLADIFSGLYLSSAILTYHMRQKDDAVFFEWAMQHVLLQIQTAFQQLLANFPKPALGKLLSWWIFPRGAMYRGPSDAQSHALADFMQTDQNYRERLTSACYIGENGDCPAGRVEQAWHAWLTRSGQSGEALAEIEALRFAVLQVDEFTNSHYGVS